MYNLEAGCIECDACYGLIKKRVNDHREKLQRLRTLLQDILENPTVANDTNFDNKLKNVMQAVKDLAASVKASLGK
jgi:laminin gamma 1